MASEFGEGRHGADEASAEAPKSASFTLLTPEMTAFFTATDLVGKPVAMQRTASQRHRPTRYTNRIRPAVTVPAAAGETAPAVGAAVPPQSQKAAQIDPIGDLLRGLGIGRDS